MLNPPILGPKINKSPFFALSKVVSFQYLVNETKIRKCGPPFIKRNLCM